MIHKISDIQHLYHKKLSSLKDQTVIIENEGAMGLSWSSKETDIYNVAFEYLMRNCVGEKPDILDSWYNKDVVLEKLEDDIELVNVNEKLKDVPIGYNFGHVWRNHSSLGDQISSLVSRVIIQMYSTHTIEETLSSEEEDFESIDISDNESVMKCHYSHYYFYKNTFNCIITCENISMRELVFHHNMRHLLMRMITQQKGMSGVHLGSISFVIHAFNPDKFYDILVYPITLKFPSEQLFKDIFNLEWK